MARRKLAARDTRTGKELLGRARKDHAATWGWQRPNCVCVSAMHEYLAGAAMLVRVHLRRSAQQRACAYAPPEAHVLMLSAWRTCAAATCARPP